MGLNQVQFTVTARLSSHNDERDARDLAQWESFKERVQDLAEQPEFAGIEVYVG